MCLFVFRSPICIILLIGLFAVARCEFELHESIYKTLQDIVESRYPNQIKKTKCINDELRRKNVIEKLSSSNEIDFDDEKLSIEVNKLVDRINIKCSVVIYLPSISCVVISLLIMVTIWACIKDCAPHLSRTMNI